MVGICKICKVRNITKRNIRFYHSNLMFVFFGFNFFSRISSRQRGGELISLSLTEPIRDEDLDVLVIKLTDDLVRLSDPVCRQRVQNVENYIHTHPNVKVFDPVESQRLTVDRLSLAKLFQHLDTNGRHLGD
jgi:hypothetical protein